MNTKTTVLIIGATGAQGGSVARQLLQTSNFHVRCLTRNPQSNRARALQQAGAEVVKGDLNDKESIMKALEGCTCVFGVTDFWEHAANEYKQGVNLIDAVVESGVSHFIFSTQPYTYQQTEGALSVPQFDIKGRLEAYAKSRKPDTIFVHLAFYYENFIDTFPPIKGADGSYFISFPQGNTPLAAVSPDDLGGILLPVFENPAAYSGKTISAVGDVLTGEEFAEALSRVTGKKFRYLHIPRKIYATAAIPHAENYASMFEYYRAFKPFGSKEKVQTQELYPSIKSFEQRMKEKKEALAAVL